MSIPVTCPSCQYHFAVPVEFAGKRGKCPKCAAIFVASAAETPAPAPTPAPARSALPPVRLKTAAPLAAAPAPAPLPAPAPQRPAPHPAPAAHPAPAVAHPAPAVARVSDTVRPFDTETSGQAFPSFDASPHAAPMAGSVSSVAARRSSGKHSSGKKSANNLPLWIALGAGGGVLALLLMVGLVVMLSSGGEAPRKVADNADRKKSSVTTANRPVSPTTPGRPEEGGGLLDRPRGPIEITAAPARQAVGLEEIVDGVVKIETPGLTGMAQGTGFIINDKGWIATNCHVISDATDQTRVIIRNSEYKVAGLIIKAEEHDMAIIKLAEQPFQLTVLDISYSQHPKLASKVRAIGFPDNTFNLTEGIVSNVATLAELTNDRQRAFLRSMQAAPSHLWIQHSAKISPGNSGGPLLNEENQVIGINTWVSTNIDAGYAGHINHLRDLIARASDTVTPFPKGIGVEVASTDDLFNTVFTADRVRQLVDFCDKFQWKPTTEDEFDAMAELAKLITLAKVAPPGRLPGDIGQATDVACQKLANMTWDADQIHKINAFAAEATNKPLHGNFFVATMVEPNAKLGDNARVDRMRLEGNDCRVIVQAQDRKSIAAKDARVLIVGLNSPILVTGGENTAERVILPGFHRELK